MKLFPRQVFFSVAYGCLLLQQTCQTMCPAVPRPPETLTVGYIRNVGDMLTDCGCALNFKIDAQFNPDRCVFVVGTSGTALMNINGRDTRLYVVSHAEPKKPLKKGDRINASYASGRTTVRVNCTVTETCSETEKECRLVYVDATITVNRTTLDKKTLEKKFNATGACGCP